MAAQYWVGDFFIDLTRNQITKKAQSQTIPPKALAVLTYLAKNANKVVSHGELLSEVWPNTVVTPNTLQRSIAQLRKALGEDSQYQSYIKTHPKQGYSLEVEVRWQDKTEAESLIRQDSSSTVETAGEHEVAQGPIAPTPHPIASIADIADIKSTDLSVPSGKKPSRSTLSLISILAGIVIIGFVGVKYLTPEPSLKLSFGELRLLTTTDNKELANNYSPDGEYVVFLRYSEEFCANNIWAKNIKTQEETQLTKNMGEYGNHSFSKDGKKLVFIESETCNKPITQKKCYNLMSLDFQKALEAPQSPSVLLECKNSRIARPMWLNNNNIALVQQFSNRWKLTSFSIADNKSTVIYEQKEGSVFDFDYSAKDDIIALTSIHSDGHNYIDVLKPDGQILSSHRIKYPKEIAKFRFIYPNFSPLKNQLVFSTGRQLFTLSYEGEITNISLPLDGPMGSPVFHPDGKRMLMIKGHYDSDIATMPLSQIAQTQADQAQTNQSNVNQSDTNKSDTNKSNNLSILERSILGEDSAIFQPRGELVAFRSERSGSDQLWITDGSSAQQLTNFPIDSNIYGMDWAIDGKSILVNANKELNQIFLDSSQKYIPFTHPVSQLFHWNSADNTVLLTVRIKGILTFVELDLNSAEFRVITDKKVNWALKAEDGKIVYTDDLERFWISGPAEYQLIDSLDSQGSDKRFVIKNNVIYGINDEFQLWSYDLNEEIFKILGYVPKNIDYLSGINQTQLLMTVRISSKKEVVELSLKE